MKGGKWAKRISWGILLLLYVSSYAYSQPEKAPFNPLFVRFLEDVRVGIPWTIATFKSCHLGYIPVLIGVSYILSTKIASKLKNLLHITTCDLQDFDRVTLVRNRGECYSCEDCEVRLWKRTPGNSKRMGTVSKKECEVKTNGTGHNLVSKFHLAFESLKAKGQVIWAYGLPPRAWQPIALKIRKLISRWLGENGVKQVRSMGVPSLSLRSSELVRVESDFQGVSRIISLIQITSNRVVNEY